jgi:hypothetical protein
MEPPSHSASYGIPPFAVLTCGCEKLIKSCRQQRELRPFLERIYNFRSFTNKTMIRLGTFLGIRTLSFMAVFSHLDNYDNISHPTQKENSKAKYSEGNSLRLRRIMSRTKKTQFCNQENRNTLLRVKSLASISPKVHRQNAKLLASPNGMFY